MVEVKCCELIGVFDFVRWLLSDYVGFCCLVGSSESVNSKKVVKLVCTVMSL